MKKENKMKKDALEYWENNTTCDFRKDLENLIVFVIKRAKEPKNEKNEKK